MEVTTEVTKNIPIPPGPGKANLLYFVWLWIPRKGNANIYPQEMHISISLIIIFTIFGPRSSWFGWKKPGFSLAFHLRLWVGSFLDIADLQQLKNAEIFIFTHYRALAAFCDVSPWSKRPLDFLDIWIFCFSSNLDDSYTVGKLFSK